MPPVDLRTTYLGLELASPLVAASSPLTGDLDAARRLEAAGAAAVVLPSLFQEQVEHEELELGRLHDFQSDRDAEATGYFPELERYAVGADGYLRLVEAARAALRVPVIASLNGVSPAGWAKHARRVEAAGASAIELNLHHVPVDPERSGAEVENLYVEQLAAVRGAVAVPVAVKLGPHLSAPAHLAARLEAAGADGLVLFNRFLEPDLDLEELRVVPRLELSRAADLRLALRWIAILSARRRLSLGATGGVETAEDVLKLLLAGADAVLVASTLLRHGAARLAELLDGLRRLCEEHEYASVRQLRGSMDHGNCPDPAGYERGNYMRALTSWTNPLA